MAERLRTTLLIFIRQARKNVYLGGKFWASYLSLESMFKLLEMSQLADSAHASALLSANTLANAFDENLGFIPQF